MKVTVTDLIGGKQSISGWMFETNIVMFIFLITTLLKMKHLF